MDPPTEQKDEEQKSGVGQGRNPRLRVGTSSKQDQRPKRRWPLGKPHYDRDRLCKMCRALNTADGNADIDCGHEVESGLATIDHSDLICIFAPWKIWKPTARTIGDIDRGSRMAEMYLNIFLWIFDLATALYYADCCQEDRAKKFHPVVVWESVPNEEGFDEANPEDVTLAGVRIRLSCHRIAPHVVSNNPAAGLTYCIWNRMKNNTLLGGKASHQFNSSEWLSICEEMGALGANNAKVYLEPRDVIEPDGICNPLTVFSMERSIRASQMYRPNYRNSQLSDYQMPLKRRWIFPFPHFAFKLALGHYNSAEPLKYIYLPHHKPLPSRAQIEADIQQYCARTGDNPDDNLRHRFKYYPTVEPEGPVVFTLRRLKEKQKTKIAQFAAQAAAQFPPGPLRTQEEVDRCYWLSKEYLKLVFVDGLRMFAAKIWIPDTLSLPPCVKRNVVYWNEHLTKYKTPCLPRPHTFSNLSRIADLLVNLSLSLHTMDHVQSAHQDILRMYISSLQVYVNTSLHNNELMIGKAMNGKSFAMKVVMNLLIFKTWINLIYRTAKSDTGLEEIPKDLQDRVLDDEELIAFMPNEQRVCFNEEVPLESLGIVPNKGAGMISEKESLEKNKRTSNTITASVLRIDKEGNRIREERTIANSAVYFDATNEFDKRLNSSAMASRCYVNDQPARNMGKVIHAILAKKTPQGNILHEWNLERFRFIQCRVCKLFQQIRASALPRIDTTASDVLITQVLHRGRTQRLRDLDQLRHFQRASYLAETLCAIEAIDLYYDSHITPLQGLPWAPELDIGIRKYLRTTTEHGSIAMGLLQNQWEDPLIPLMEKVLEEIFLKEADRWKTRDATNPVKRDQEKKEREDHEALLMGSGQPVPGSHDDLPLGARWPQLRHTYDRLELPQERKRILFNNCKTFSKMLEKVRGLAINTPTETQKPNSSAIGQLITDLLKMKVSVRTHGGGVQKVPALSISLKMGDRGNIVYEFSMPRTTSDGSRGGNRLMATVANVLNRRYQRPRTVLYGGMKPDNPFLFETINVNPPSDAKPMRILQSAWFPDSVKQAAMRMSSMVGVNRYDPVPSIEQSQVFSKSVKHIELNMDLDEWAIEDFNIRSGLTDVELKTKPSVWPRHQEEELAENNYGGIEPAEEYPDAFKDCETDEKHIDDIPTVMKATEMLAKLREVCRGEGTDEDRTLVAQCNPLDVPPVGILRDGEEEIPHLEEEEQKDSLSNHHPLTFLWQNNYLKSYNIIDAKFWSLEERPDVADGDGADTEVAESSGSELDLEDVVSDDETFRDEMNDGSVHKHRGRNAQLTAPARVQSIV